MLLNSPPLAQCYAESFFPAVAALSLLLSQPSLACDNIQFLKKTYTDIFNILNFKAFITP